MEDRRKPDWDSRAADVLKNQIAAYDEMRHKCPVAYCDNFGWSLFKYEDIMRVLLDHETFSSSVSHHVSVPNSMDPPQHAGYRNVIQPFFAPEPMKFFEATCRDLAVKLVNELTRGASVEFISDFAMKYALQVQCAFLGWPEDMQESLRLWMQKNHAATHSMDRSQMADVAAEFAGFIHTILEKRRTTPDTAPDDIISQLIQSEVNGHPLSEMEIVSILRNWTGGEVGTISAAVGILVHYLADHPRLQAELRANPDKLLYAIDEILRIHGPLVSNRRRATCPVTICGRQIEEGDRVTIFWVSANRDEDVFEDPDTFRWDRDQSRNLLYGAGIHWCPGAPLARLELRIVTEELLARTTNLTLLPDISPLPAPSTLQAASPRLTLSLNSTRPFHRSHRKKAMAHES